MAERYYYLMSALPALPNLFEPLPLGPSAFLSVVRREGAEAEELADAVLAEVDLWALCSGVEEYKPVSKLANNWPRHRESPSWQHYEEQLLTLSARLRCSFLRKATLFDRFLRTALTKHRSSSAQKAHSQTGEGAPFIEGIAERMAQHWSAEAAVHNGYRMLMLERYEWLKDEWPLEPFSIDELCAYAKALTLLHRARTEAAQRVFTEQ